MKATVNGIQLEGTAEEIHEYVKLARTSSNVNMELKLDTKKFAEMVRGFENSERRKRGAITR